VTNPSEPVKRRRVRRTDVIAALACRVVELEAQNAEQAARLRVLERRRRVPLVHIERHTLWKA
jgi:hypothetical protein